MLTDSTFRPPNSDSTHHSASFHTAKDYIHYGKVLHEQLAHKLHKLNAQEHNTRKQLLMDYLCEHEERMQNLLNKYEVELSPKILNAWFQFTPERLSRDFIPDFNFDEQHDAHDITMHALELDDYLIALYQELAEHTDIPAVKETMKQIVEIEQQEKMRTVKSGMSINDF